MKVTGPSAPTAAPTSRPTRAPGGFSLSSTAGAAPAPATTASAGPAGVAGLSALMALQGVESATERRRRAIRRGGGLLDRLDELKLALLSGEAGEGVLERLGQGLREERTEDDDPGLTDLLNQIDLRAAVELAKAESRRSAA
ncbi:flagellar assembly regulator FliX [soil metagenome]